MEISNELKKNSNGSELISFEKTIKDKITLDIQFLTTFIKCLEEDRSKDDSQAPENISILDNHIKTLTTAYAFELTEDDPEKKNNIVQSYKIRMQRELRELRTKTTNILKKINQLFNEIKELDLQSTENYDLLIRYSQQLRTLLIYKAGSIIRLYFFSLPSNNNIVEAIRQHLPSRNDPCLYINNILFFIHTNLVSYKQKFPEELKAKIENNIKEILHLTRLKEIFETEQTFIDELNFLCLILSHMQLSNINNNLRSSNTQNIVEAKNKIKEIINSVSRIRGSFLDGENSESITFDNFFGIIDYLHKMIVSSPFFKTALTYITQIIQTYNRIVKENTLTKYKNEIYILFDKIPNYLKFFPMRKNEDIINIISNTLYSAFQRLGRYHLLFSELLNATPQTLNNQTEKTTPYKKIHQINEVAQNCGDEINKKIDLSTAATDKQPDTNLDIFSPKKIYSHYIPILRPTYFLMAEILNTIEDYLNADPTRKEEAEEIRDTITCMFFKMPLSAQEAVPAKIRDRLDKIGKTRGGKKSRLYQKCYCVLNQYTNPIIERNKLCNISNPIDHIQNYIINQIIKIMDPYQKLVTETQRAILKVDIFDHIQKDLHELINKSPKPESDLLRKEIINIFSKHLHIVGEIPLIFYTGSFAKMIKKIGHYLDKITPPEEKRDKNTFQLIMKAQPYQHIESETCINAENPVQLCATINKITDFYLNKHLNPKNGWKDNISILNKNILRIFLQRDENSNENNILLNMLKQIQRTVYTIRDNMGGGNSRLANDLCKVYNTHAKKFEHNPNVLTEHQLPLELLLSNDKKLPKGVNITLERKEAFNYVRKHLLQQYAAPFLKFYEDDHYRLFKNTNQTRIKKANKIRKTLNTLYNEELGETQEEFNNFIQNAKDQLRKIIYVGEKRHALFSEGDLADALYQSETTGLRI